MLRFVVRRFVSMMFVLFSISVLSFLIFFATPGVDPAARIAGRNADQADAARRCARTSGSTGRCPCSTR